MKPHPLSTWPWFASFSAVFSPGRLNRRPALALDSTEIDGRRVPLNHRIVTEKPFARLVHLERAVRRADPRLLVVAPLSGHFPALLRDMLAALAPEHDLYFTDWTDARHVPVESGDFGLEDNIEYVMDFIRTLGGGVNVLALCQAALPALAATALLAAAGGALEPRTLTLISGILDPRISPTRMAHLASRHPLAWYENNTIVPVPAGYAGSGRLVYPADFRHAALMAYLMQHLAGGGELLDRMLEGDRSNPASSSFLDIYLSVMDLPAAFFLDTVRLVYQQAALPEGRLSCRGARVDLAAITRTALMTVEGTEDDVSPPGQTRVAHALCTHIPHRRRLHHLQPGVGHFGTFHGPAWRNEIMPSIRDFIRAMAPRPKH